MLKAFDLKGKTAIVTGASRGLGKASALALVQSNANVVITGRDERTLSKTADELSQYGSTVTSFVCDITNPDEVLKLKEFIITRFGTLDILVNNAGIVIDKPFLQTSDDEIDTIMNTNLLGMMKLTRILGEIMVTNKNGKIINIGSYDGLVGTPNLAAYGTSKGGVVQFTRMLAIEWARYKINVNVICPGYFHTSMNDEVFQNEEITNKILKRIPLRRIGKPDELGPLIVYLSSEGSDYMTGQVLAIDGGETSN
ncbi:glucose 1-dehydrogenase [Neobacillus sp. YX16]|uniref:SDR family NAD(P)-dependent oxidoreductase n=1 Tax=Neobacillus sp. YX16 TaxID=3047874 RepID=UPI0024C34E76|nr:glucose 1-dehydrogenase [Neobacillus sp. YX16]WHZ00883.1 glucose 1-dehydrogenase [Neobacillus sp. YX16]